MNIPYMAIGNNESVGNKKIVPGESIPCRNCGTLCVIKTTTEAEVNGELVKSSCSLETTNCNSCGKMYLVGINHISLER